jgi:hypothetical protein
MIKSAFFTDTYILNTDHFIYSTDHFNDSQIMLSMIIKRFRFELIPGQKHVPDIAITLRLDSLYFILLSK